MVVKNQVLKQLQTFRPKGEMIRGEHNSCISPQFPLSPNPSSPTPLGDPGQVNQHL